MDGSVSRKKQPGDLSRRERQMMDVVYRLGRATAKEVLEGLEDPPSYSAVRATLSLLEQKGQLRHVQDGLRYLYVPTVTRDRAKKSALRHLLTTFFGGSPAGAISALIDESASKLSEEELDALEEKLRAARRDEAPR